MYAFGSSLETHKTLIIALPKRTHPVELGATIITSRAGILEHRFAVSKRRAAQEKGWPEPYIYAPYMTVFLVIFLPTTL
jgi:hypothetical protein